MSGAHEVSVNLRVVGKKVTLTVTDHVKANILNRWDSCTQAVGYGLAYYFNKPLTVMVGRMPLTVMPSMLMTTLMAGNGGTGGSAHLVTNLDHTMGATYQTGKPITPINDDSSTLGKSTYNYDTVSHCGVTPVNYGHMEVSSRDYATLLAQFVVNGFTVKTGLVDWDDTQGDLQKIPKGEDASGAFTLPGVSGKLRGSLEPRAHILTSIVAGTDTALTGLDGSSPIAIKNVLKDKKTLTQPKRSFSTVRDTSWLTNADYVTYVGVTEGEILSFEPDGSFKETGSASEGANKPSAGFYVHGKFDIPPNASKDRPFFIHLRSVKYEHLPEDNMDKTVIGKDGPYYPMEARGLYWVQYDRPFNLQTDLLHDFIVYPAGTAESSLPKDVKESPEYYEEKVGENGKTKYNIFVGVRDGENFAVCVYRKSTSLRSILSRSC